MANVKLTNEKTEMLETIMTELEIPAGTRAPALRLAFAKGIDSEHSIDLEIKNGSGAEFPTSVIKQNSSTLIKHLIINKLGRSIDEYNFNRVILAIVERGIEDMYNEIQQLSHAESYL